MLKVKLMVSVMSLIVLLGFLGCNQSPLVVPDTGVKKDPVFRAMYPEAQAEYLAIVKSKMPEIQSITEKGESENDPVKKQAAVDQVNKFYSDIRLDMEKRYGKNWNAVVNGEPVTSRTTLNGSFFGERWYSYFRKSDTFVGWDANNNRVYLVDVWGQEEIYYRQYNVIYSYAIVISDYYNWNSKWWRETDPRFVLNSYSVACDNAVITQILADDTNTPVAYGQQSVRPSSAIQVTVGWSAVKRGNAIFVGEKDGIYYNGAIFEAFASAKLGFWESDDWQLNISPNYPSNIPAPSPSPVVVSAFEGAICCPADYDADGKADLSIKTKEGTWCIDYSKNGFGNGWDITYSNYGDNTVLPVPADYDGDGYADLSVKTSEGYWCINYAVDGLADGWDVSFPNYGNSNIPVPADYDGDGKTDLSVRTNEGYWCINYSLDGFDDGWDICYPNYGNTVDEKPVPADYDGDGKADLSIKTKEGIWCINYSRNGFENGWDITYGNYGDKTVTPLPADYDGDGYADLSVKTSDGYWCINYAVDGLADGWDVCYPYYGNTTGDKPVPADYDGDGKCDLSIVTSQYIWCINHSSNGFDNGWDMTPVLQD